jgi:hypothetical protein
MQLSRISVRDAAWKSADVIEGSGNVFADLGLPNADQELMKARLTLQTYRIIIAIRAIESMGSRV